MGKCSEQPQKNILREIIQMLTAPRHAQQRPEHHRLMLTYQLLEGEIVVQAGLDHTPIRKFHALQ